MPEVAAIKTTNEIKPEPRPVESHSIYCGLIWPERGFPAYYCAVGNKIEARDKSFESSPVTLQIFQEGEAKTFKDLTEKLQDLPKAYTKAIYSLLEPRFASYVWDFNRWKHDSGQDLKLRNTRSSSFEVSLLKIKEYTKGKRLIFPENSLIRTQLSMFSKENLKDEVELYAVRALSMVIGAFDKKRGDGTAEVVPKLRAWW